MSRDQTIIKGYSQAGDEFLADRLRKIFSELNTPEDIALHNDMLRDVQAMVGGDGHELRRTVARILLAGPKNFLRSVAYAINKLSIRNLTDGKKEKAK